MEVVTACDTNPFGLFYSRRQPPGWNARSRSKEEDWCLLQGPGSIRGLSASPHAVRTEGQGSVHDVQMGKGDHQQPLPP